MAAQRQRAGALSFKEAADRLRTWLHSPQPLSSDQHELIATTPEDPSCWFRAVRGPFAAYGGAAWTRSVSSSSKYNCDVNSKLRRHRQQCES